MGINKSLKRGSIFLIYSERVNPPKEKFIVVWGIDSIRGRFALSYINSEINPHIFSTPALRELHLPLNPIDYPFLSHDSFLDCAQIDEDSLASINEEYRGDPGIYKGELKRPDLLKAEGSIKSAITIKTSIKKRYGFVS